MPNNAVTTMARALSRIAAYETPLRPSRAVVGLFASLADQQPFPNSFVMRHVDNPLVRTLFRSQLTQRPLVNAMLRTTISLTGMQGGYKTNVIPAQVEATLFKLTKVRGPDTIDHTNTNFTTGLHVGYFIIPMLSLGAEIRHQRWLSTPKGRLGK